MKRIVFPRRAGITKSKGVYYQGVRCEALVAARVAEYPARSKRGAGNAGTPRKPRSPSAQLRRLERALARRKTLAARQRVQSQIDLLRRELGQ